MTIKRVAVLGAGVMGRGIAQVAAMAGYETHLYDIDQAQLDGAMASIKATLDKGVARQKVEATIRELALGLLKSTTDLEVAVGQSDLVIEAVPEKIELKLALFEKLDALTPSHAILASNTSALSLTEIAAVVNDPGRVIGMHFFNPVHIMKLVEVIGALETREAVLLATEAVAERMGKEVVRVNESPGFVTSRINVLIGNEAFYMLQEGVASAEGIDKAIKLGLNHPMGPFEMGDLVGLDTRLATLKHLHRTLGEKYRPSPLLEKYVKAGRLGRKVGKGVYDYEPKS